MSVSFNPYGFSHVERVGGKPRAHTFQFPLAVPYATTIAAGDVAVLSNLGTTGGNGGVVSAADQVINPAGPVVATGVGGTVPPCGVFVAFSYIAPNGQSVLTPIWTASTPVFPGTCPTATVDIDPNAIFQVQCDGTFAFTNPGLQTAIGRNYTFNPGTPNTNTQTSTASLAIATSAGSASGTVNAWYPFKIIGLAEIPNNNWTDAFPQVLVIPNFHFLRSGTQGVA